MFSLFVIKSCNFQAYNLCIEFSYIQVFQFPGHTKQKEKEKIENEIQRKRERQIREKKKHTLEFEFLIRYV